MAAFLNSPLARVVLGETAALPGPGSPCWDWDILVARSCTNCCQPLVLLRSVGATVIAARRS